MEPQFQRSFIPKRPITSSSGRVGSTVNLFALVGIVLFIVSLALSGAAFFYNNLITKQIDDDKASLDRAKGAFEPELIQQIIRRDTRLETAKGLIATHVSVTPLFDYLSTITLKSVRFRDFNFSYLAADKIQVTMKGQGQSYASVALQSDLLSTQKNLHDTVLSDMSLEPAGTVAFGVSTTVDPSVFAYASSISGNTGGGTTAAPVINAPAVSLPLVPPSSATTSTAGTSTIPKTGTSTTPKI